MVGQVRDLVARIQPERTVLLFGSGSSIPSNVPSVRDLQNIFELKFGVAAADYSLAEQTGIIEAKTGDRRGLIEALRAAFKGVSPTGALLNLPLFNWKSIFTTNYDELIETSYTRRNRPFAMYSSNFDFGKPRPQDAVQLFKLHGTIGKDVADGDRSRIILTSADYDLTEEYREQLFDRFRADIGGDHLVIIGHSLADPDIKAVVDRALTIKAKAGGGGEISILSYSRDDGRAALLRSRGMSVYFGGLDDFFASLSARVAGVQIGVASSDDPLDIQSSLRPATVDVAHALATGRANVSNMFNGWPATYSDIKSGLTFPRTSADQIATQLSKGEKPISVVLGPSGVGKTTASRQVLANLLDDGFLCWEHKRDQALYARDWRAVASLLKKSGRKGCLLVDDAHLELHEVNDLIDYLASDGNNSLRLVLTSSKSQWHPRVKSHHLPRMSEEYAFSNVSENEVNGLLDLVENVPEIKALVEDTFSGFTRSERRQRLINRCDADMFVCLKNIFSSDKIDDIVLREYAELKVGEQEVYRAVAAMESSGVRVHRQLVIRILGIQSMAIAPMLAGLSDIIHEQTVSEREGIYAWRGRHPVIMGIIAEHKYYNQKSRYELFDRVIDNVSPTYDIEVRTLKELCNVETGIATIHDRRDQNVLLRKIMSVAPRERVPRHRLIRNLIALGDYDTAATEIRVFEKDFGLDGPASRYRIDLSVGRAVHSPGLMDEDRIVILQKTAEMAAGSAARFSLNKAVLAAYCEVGVELARLSQDTSVFDHAISVMKAAEAKTHDVEMTRIISRFENAILRIMAGFEAEPILAEEEIQDD